MHSHEHKSTPELNLPVLSKLDIEVELRGYEGKKSCAKRRSEGYLRLQRFYEQLDAKDLTEYQLLPVNALIELAKIIITPHKKPSPKTVVLFNNLKKLIGIHLTEALADYFKIHKTMPAAAFQIIYEAGENAPDIAIAIATKINEHTQYGYSQTFSEKLIPHLFDGTLSHETFKTVRSLIFHLKLDEEPLLTIAKECPAAIIKLNNLLFNRIFKAWKTEHKQKLGNQLALLFAQSNYDLSVLTELRSKLENYEKITFRFRALSANSFKSETIHDFEKSCHLIIEAILDNLEKIDSIIELSVNLLKYDFKPDALHTTISLEKHGFYKGITPRYLTEKNIKLLLKNVEDVAFYDQAAINELLEIKDSSTPKKEFHRMSFSQHTPLENKQEISIPHFGDYYEVRNSEEKTTQKIALQACMLGMKKFINLNDRRLAIAHDKQVDIFCGIKHEKLQSIPLPLPEEKIRTLLQYDVSHMKLSSKGNLLLIGLNEVFSDDDYFFKKTSVFVVNLTSTAALRIPADSEILDIDFVTDSRLSIRYLQSSNAALYDFDASLLTHQKFKRFESLFFQPEEQSIMEFKPQLKLTI